MIHLSARLAWHDGGWNGCVCQEPHLNSLRIFQENICNDIGSRMAGRSWALVEAGCCVGACGTSVRTSPGVPAASAAVPTTASTSSGFGWWWRPLSSSDFWLLVSGVLAGHGAGRDGQGMRSPPHPGPLPDGEREAGTVGIAHGDGNLVMRPRDGAASQMIRKLNSNG
jgi:hypothetical protein